MPAVTHFANVCKKKCFQVRRAKNDVRHHSLGRAFYCMRIERLVTNRVVVSYILPSYTSRFEGRRHPCWEVNLLHLGVVVHPIALSGVKRLLTEEEYEKLIAALRGGEG